MTKISFTPIDEEQIKLDWDFDNPQAGSGSIDVQRNGEIIAENVQEFTDTPPEKNVLYDYKVKKSEWSGWPFKSFEFGLVDESNQEGYSYIRQSRDLEDFAVIRRSSDNQETIWKFPPCGVIRLNEINDWRAGADIYLVEFFCVTGSTKWGFISNQQKIVENDVIKFDVLDQIINGL